jgi:hypothetical protein
LIWCSDWLLGGGESDHLDTILGEFPEAQRIVHVAGEVPADFVERHARRAPVIREKESVGPPHGRVRYALAGGNGLAWAVRSCLDSLDPGSAFVWDPDNRLGHHPLLAAQPNVEIGAEPSETGYDLAIAAALPTAAILRGIQETARETAVLLRPAQLPALKGLSPGSKPIRLPSEADRSRDRAFRLRELVRESVGGAGENPNSLGFALQAVEPLFYEHDPALVAAALAARAFAAAPEPEPREDLPAWVKIFVTAGKKDGLGVRDVVGAILNSTGIPRDSVGKVDIRDSHTLVEISPEHTTTVVAELNGSTLKGRRLTARVDRKGQPAR